MSSFGIYDLTRRDKYPRQARSQPTRARATAAAARASTSRPAREVNVTTAGACPGPRRPVALTSFPESAPDFTHTQESLRRILDRLHIPRSVLTSHPGVTPAHGAIGALIAANETGQARCRGSGVSVAQPNCKSTDPQAGKDL